MTTDTLLSCLDDIRDGRRSLDECVAAHPESGGELRQLVGITERLRLDGMPRLDPAAKLHGRNQLLAAISSNGHRHAEDRAVLTAAHGWREGLWRRVAGKPRWLGALGGGLAALAAGSAVVYASQGAAPASPLYPVHEAVHAVTQAFVPPQPTATSEVSPMAVPPATATALAAPRSAPAASRIEVVREAGSASPAPTRDSHSDGNRDDARERSIAPAASAGAAQPSNRDGDTARGRDQRGDEARGRDQRHGDERQSAVPSARPQGREAGASGAGRGSD